MSGMQNSSEGYYYLPYTYPVHLPGLVSSKVSDSPHLPMEQVALPPEVPGLTDIAPERVGTDFGQDTSFKWVSNDHELIKDCILAVKLAPLTAGAGGTQARYHDDVLCAAIDKIDFQIGGTTLQTLYGDAIHHDQLVECTPEDLARLHAAQRADLTVAQRATLAAIGTSPDGFWVFLELPFWFSEVASKHWHQYACQRQTRIVVRWRGAEDILQQTTANTKPVPAVGATYIVDTFLRFRVSALDTATKDAFTNSVKSLGSTGLNYLIRYNQRQEANAVATGATSTSIQLTHFNKPTYMCRVIVRPRANLTPNYLTNNRFAYTAVDEFYSDASGHRLATRVTDFYHKYLTIGKEFLGNPAINIYHLLFTDYPDVKQYPTGCIEFAKLQNPLLNLVWDAALGADQVVDVYAYCYDYIRLVVTADNRSAVALEQPI